MAVNLKTFNPKEIPWQFEATKAIRKQFNYALGVHEILCSGSVGSAKSEWAAHMAITHCLMYKNARFLLGREAMPRLRQTVIKKILDHLSDVLEEGRDFWHHKTNGTITFSNGSEMIPISWHDKDYQKFRSYEFSAGWIEELTENDSEETKNFHIEMIARIGRINSTNSHVKENFVIYTTNPSDPDHYAYEYFFTGGKRIGNYLSNHPLRHVFFSLTEQNKFLPSWYISSLRERYDSKMIKRLLEGQWIYINTDVIYYEYNPEEHFTLKNTQIDPSLEIRLSFDFNISKGKPMSSVLFQYDTSIFKFIDEVAVEGARTQDALEEWAGKGYLDTKHNPPIIIHGDATGNRGDSRGKNSDYDIIEKFLANYQRKDGQKLIFDIDVPSINPPIRERHNKVNGQLKSASGKISIKIDERCKTLNKGFLGVKLKEGAKYLEDQTSQGQDITTAAGYGICSALENSIKLQPIKLR
jgi:PBSX family phage terminase large subunit